MLKKQDPQPNVTVLGAACALLPLAPGKTSPVLQSPLPAAPAISHTQAGLNTRPCWLVGYECQDPGYSEQPGHGVTAAASEETRGEGDQDRHAKDCGREALNARSEHFQH